MSEEAKLNHLLNELTPGDRTPSQLLQEMKQLGGDKVTSELLKSLWLRRLPESTRIILACAESGLLEVLSATADKVYEVYARSVVAEVSRDATREIDELKTMVTTLASHETYSDGRYVAFGE